MFTIAIICAAMDCLHDFTIVVHNSNKCHLFMQNKGLHEPSMASGMVTSLLVEIMAHCTQESFLPKIIVREHWPMVLIVS